MATAADVDLREWVRQLTSPIWDGNNPQTLRDTFFFGYPYVSLSSITIPSIEVATTNTEAPMAVFASASNVTAVGSRTLSSTTVRPYMDIEYRWTLTKNDDSAVEDLESVTDPRTGNSVNPYTDQVSPEFTCILREPGTYKLKLTARGMSSSFGNVIEQTATTTITVAASSLTKNWYDITSGNDANDGLDPHGFALSTATYTHSTRELTQSGAFASYTHDTSARYTERDNYIYIDKVGFEGLYEIESKTSNDTIVLKTGLGSDQTAVTSSDGPKQNWDGTTLSGVEIMLKGGGSSYDVTVAPTSRDLANPVAVTGYGSQPTVTSTTGVNLFDMGLGTSQSMPDYVRVSNINFDAQDGRGTASGNTINGTVSSTGDLDTSTIIVDNCNAVNSSDDNGVQIQNNIGNKVMHLLMYKLYVDNRYNSTGKAQSKQGIYTDIRNGGWTRGFGLTIDNDADTTTLDHFYYPNGDTSHFHLAYTETRNGTGNGFALNLNRADNGESRHCSINNNKFGPNSSFGLDASAASNETLAKYFNDVVFTNNLCNTEGCAIFAYSPWSISVSYNQAYGGESFRGFYTQPEGANFNPDNFESIVFGNEVYGQFLFDDSTGATREVMDNVAWQTADDEVLRYDNTAYGARELDVDGNNLYAPNKTGSLIIDEGAANVTLATFNTDLSATNTSTQPDWSDPANGDFGGVPTGIQVAL